MYSQASVILFTGGLYPSMHWANTHLVRHLPPTQCMLGYTPPHWADTPPPPPAATAADGTHPTGMHYYYYYYYYTVSRVTEFVVSGTQCT